MRSISVSSSELDESLDELEDWLLLEDESASGGAPGSLLQSSVITTQKSTNVQRPECPEVMTMLWKECITWATQSRQIYRTLAGAIHATVRHTCKAKSSGKLQFPNRHFVISGVLSPPPPTPTKTIVAVLYSSLVPLANAACPYPHSCSWRGGYCPNASKDAMPAGEHPPPFRPRAPCWYGPSPRKAELERGSCFLLPRHSLRCRGAAPGGHQEADGVSPTWTYLCSVVQGCPMWSSPRQVPQT